MTEATGSSRRRTTLAALALLLLAGVVAGGIALFGGGHRKAAAARPSATPTPSSPRPSPSPSPFDPNAIPAGECFDSPGLSRIGTVVVVPCTGRHDAESVTVITLPAHLTGAGQLLAATSTACGKPLTAAWDRQPDRTALHVWNRYPDLAAYRAGHHRATCAISASITLGGAKLTAPLR